MIGLDADLVQDRQALGGTNQDRLEPVHVLGKELPSPIERDALGPAGRRALLPAADGERFHIGLQIEDAVRVAERRRVVRDGDLLLGDDILVLDGARRERNAGHLADALGPDAGGVDDALAVDLALVREDALDAAAVEIEAGYENAFAEAGAAGPCTFDEGHRQRIGIDVAVGRNPGGADDAVERHPGKLVLRVLRRDLVGFEAETLRLRQRAADFRHAHVARGDAQ